MSSDSATPGGKLVLHVFGALAEFERELILERTKAGLTAARARGRKGGRPTVMSVEKLKPARELYDARELTVSEIAAMLKVSRASIYRHVRPLWVEALHRVLRARAVVS